MPVMGAIIQAEISTILEDFGPFPSLRLEIMPPTMLACPPKGALNLGECSAHRIMSVRLIVISFLAYVLTPLRSQGFGTRFFAWPDFFYLRMFIFPEIFQLQRLIKTFPEVPRVNNQYEKQPPWLKLSNGTTYSSPRRTQIFFGLVNQKTATWGTNWISVLWMLFFTI